MATVPSPVLLVVDEPGDDDGISGLGSPVTREKRTEQLRIPVLLVLHDGPGSVPVDLVRPDCGGILTSVEDP